MKYNTVNGSQLPVFINQKVIITGLASNAAARGTSFKLDTTDNQQITISLDMPLSKPIDGYVEVRGKCLNKSTIQAEDFVCFSNKEFDALGYNGLCSILCKKPDVL